MNLGVPVGFNVIRRFVLTDASSHRSLVNSTLRHTGLLLFERCVHVDIIAGDTPASTAGIYADRATGRNRDHRRFDRIAVARRSASS